MSALIVRRGSLSLFLKPSWFQSVSLKNGFRHYVHVSHRPVCCKQVFHSQTERNLLKPLQLLVSRSCQSQPSETETSQPTPTEVLQHTETETSQLTETEPSQPTETEPSQLTETLQPTETETDSSFLDQTLIGGRNFLELITSLEYNASVLGVVSLKDFQKCLDELTTVEEKNYDREFAILLRMTGSHLQVENKQQQLEIVQQVWSKLQEINAQLDVKHYNTLLLVYQENGNKYSPVDIVAEMSSKDISMNEVTFERLIRRYCENGEMDAAINLIEHMKAAGYGETESVYNSLMLYNFKTNNTDGVQAVCDLMKNKETELTKETYTILLSGYAQSNIEKFVQVLVEAKEQNIQFHHNDFVSITRALVKSGNQDHVSLVLEKLQLGQDNHCDKVTLKPSHVKIQDLKELHEESGTSVVKQLISAIVKKKALKEENLFHLFYFNNLSLDVLTGVVNELLESGHNVDWGELVRCAFEKQFTDYGMEIYAAIPVQDRCLIWLHKAVANYKDKKDSAGLLKVVTNMNKDRKKTSKELTLMELDLYSGLEDIFGGNFDAVSTFMTDAGVSKDEVAQGWFRHLLSNHRGKALEFVNEHPDFKPPNERVDFLLFLSLPEGKRSLPEQFEIISKLPFYSTEEKEHQFGRLFDHLVQRAVSDDNKFFHDALQVLESSGMKMAIRNRVKRAYLNIEKDEKYIQKLDELSRNSIPQESEMKILDELSHISQPQESEMKKFDELSNYCQIRQSEIEIPEVSFDSMIKRKPITDVHLPPQAAAFLDQPRYDRTYAACQQTRTFDIYIAANYPEGIGRMNTENAKLRTLLNSKRKVMMDVLKEMDGFEAATRMFPSRDGMYCFARFKSKEDATKAICELDMKIKDGSLLKCRWKQERSNTYDQVYANAPKGQTDVYLIAPGLTDKKLARILCDIEYKAVSPVRLNHEGNTYAFVRFKSTEDAAKAIVELNGTTVDDNFINCSWANQLTPRMLKSLIIEMDEHPECVENVQFLENFIQQLVHEDISEKKWLWEKGYLPKIMEALLKVQETSEKDLMLFLRSLNQIGRYSDALHMVRRISRRLSDKSVSIFFKETLIREGIEQTMNIVKKWKASSFITRLMSTLFIERADDLAVDFCCKAIRELKRFEFLCDVFCHLIRNEKLDELQKVMDVNTDRFSENSTLSSLVAAFFINENLDKARKVLMQPNDRRKVIAIEAGEHLARMGKVNCLESLMQITADEDIFDREKTLNLKVLGYHKMNKPDKAKEILLEMKKDGIPILKEWRQYIPSEQLSYRDSNTSSVSSQKSQESRQGGEQKNSDIHISTAKLEEALKILDL